MKDYLVEIGSKKSRRLYKNRKYLREKGFHFVKRSFGKSYYEKRTSDEQEIEEMKTYCKHHRLLLQVHKKEHIRSHNYRKTYFDTIPQNRSYIFCAYCGLPIKRENITVDHIIPVDKVKKTAYGKGLMKILKIQDVNERRNLCGACRHCNSRKRAKMGIWVILGFIGNYQKLWYIRWGIRGCLLLAIIFSLYKI